MIKAVSKKTLCLFMAFLFTFSIVDYTAFVPALPAEAATAAELKKKQAEIKSKQATIKKKLTNLKAQKDSAQEYYDSLQELIQSVNDEISNINSQINQMNSDIKAVEAKIAEKEKEINANFEKFKQRLRAIYVSGDITGGLELILCADTFEQMISNSKYVEAMAKYDQSIIDALTQDKDGYLKDKTELEAKKAEIQEKKKELSDKKSEVDALAQEAKEKLAEIKKAQAAAEAEQRKLDAEMDAAKRQLDAIINGATNNSNNTQYTGGNFLWPTPGYYNITSPYGQRWGRMHKGIDIGAPGGAKIVAANAGTVITRAYDANGYGNYVIVDHGGGYMTVYAHMSSVSVSKGQKVSKGQQVGKVGSTGRSTGNHLHFEIRENGTAKNPMNYY